MRRARSQLSKLTQQQAGNHGGYNNPQGHHAAGSEFDEIQRRLDALQYQQGATQPNQQYYNEPGFAQQHMQPQMMPNPSIHQPMPNPALQQPSVNPYAAAAMPMENPAPSHHKSQDVASPQLDNIKAALEQMTTKLQSMNTANAASSSNQQATLQQSEILKQHYSHINTELQDLKKSIAGISTAGHSDAGLEIIQQTLSANYRAIMEQLERSQNSEIDNSIFSAALEASHKELSKQIVDTKSSIDATLSNPNAYAKTLEVSHDDITKRLDDMHNALQTSIASPDRYAESIENNHLALSQQVQQLHHVIESLEKGAPEVAEVDLSSVEMRLEEITRAVVALSLNDGNVNNLERIEARVSDMAKTLDGFSLPDIAADNSGIERLEARLSDMAQMMKSSSPDLTNLDVQFEKLSEKLESLTPNDGLSAQDAEIDNSGFDRLEARLSDMAQLMKSSSPDLGTMDVQFDKLSEKLENLSSISSSAPLSGEENNALLKRMDELVDQISLTQTQSHSDTSNEVIAQQLGQISGAIDKLSIPVEMNSSSDNLANEVIVQQLEQIAGAIDQLSMPSPENISADSFASIEQQLSEISNQINVASPTGELSLDPITNRLIGIEEQLGANRDITIELATKAAKDAVEMSVQAMPAMAVSETQMDTTVLSSMSELLAQLNQHAETTNSTNIEAFGAVTQTLDLMVKRLGKIESGLAHPNSIHQAVAPVFETAEPAQQPEVIDPQPVQVQSAPQGLLEPVAASIPAEPIEEELQTPRNPAADLVKAARTAAASVQNEVPVIAEPEMQAVVQETIETPVVEEVLVETQPVVAESELSANLTPTLPEAEAPTMAMNVMPEIQDETQPEAGPDIAIEPGTGGPDLAALVRQANDRRKNNKGTDADSSGTDFIAAARRAAQAAAQEAGAVEEEIEEKTTKSLFASLPELFAKRKKVIIMAAAAALFTVLATSLASQLFGSKDVEVAQVENTVQIEQEVDEVSLQASAVPAQNTVTPIEPVAEDIVAEAPVSEVQLVETPTLGAPDLPQELNLASVNLNENPAPASFVIDNGLDFVSTELKDAVQNGEPAALFEIGKRYTDGVGVEKDLKKAAEWYERAADLGFAPAQYIIGNFNEKGLGIEKNAAVAAQWYEQAARGGNIIAMHNLAVLTATPNALSAEPNMSEAFKWFSNAADYGVRDSQVNAGIFHTKGFGTDVNLVEAYKWFAIAAKAGDKDAGNKRDVIANAIQPDQLEIAKTLVKDWEPLEVVQAANEVPVTEAWKAPQAVAAAQAIKVDRSIIAQTQTLLSKVGFNAGVADGVMGQKTRNAIAAFQQKTGLPVNGRIDGEFLKTLKAIAI